MVSSVSSSGGSQSVQSLSDRHSRMFGKLDKDGSGGLDVNEFSAMLSNAPAGAPQVSDPASTFTSFDSNGDGSLSQGELDAGMKSLRGSSQSTVDRFGGMAPPEGPPPAASDSGSSDDDMMQKLLAALTSLADGSGSASSTSSSASSTGSTVASTSSSASVSSTDSAEAMAKKLSQMFEQMAQALASVSGGQQASSSLSVRA